jgi:hypothetical protein
LLHALDKFLDQLLERAIHLHLLQTFPHLLVEAVTIQQSLLDGLTQSVECLFTIGHFVKHVILKSALQ